MFNGCVLTGGVGTGKTVTALAYYYTKILGGVINDFESIQNPIHIYVFTTARKRDDLDWELWGMRFGLNNILHDIPKEAPHGVTLTVDSYNNIGKYTKVHGAFIIFDEQRMVGAGTWSKAFVHLAKSNRWVMLSATPGDKWEDFIPLFVAHGFYKNRTEFKRDHCVYSYYGKFPKLERYVGVNKLIKLKNSILVDMPYERHTKRHLHDVLVEYDKELFDMVVKKRWNPFEERPLRDVAELFSVMRKVVNSDLSRIEVLKCLMLKHPRLIVFYSFNYELEILRSLASFGHALVSGSGPFQKPHISEITATSLSSDILTDTLLSLISISKPSDKASSMVGIGVTHSTAGVSDIPKGGSGPSYKSRDSSRPPRGTSRSKDMNQISPSSTRLQDGVSTTISSQRVSETSLRELSDHIPRSSLTERNLMEPTASSTRMSSTTMKTPIFETSDPWEYTIWAKDYVPPVGEKDPRTDISAIKAKGEFDRKTRRSERRTSSLTTTVPTISGNEIDTDVSNLTNGLGQTRNMQSQEKIVGAPDVKREKRLKTRSFAIAEWNGHKHEPVPDTDHWVYLVQYVAGAEAWDCVTTNAVAFYSLTYSYKVFSQAQGRIDRLNTPYIDLEYYILRSKAYIDTMIKKSLTNKEDFNEKKYGKSIYA
jgi:hypothetical protein